jgi:hypothetical protein
MASDELFLYAQPDLSSSTGAEDFSIQLRDLYGDWILSDDRSLKLRMGLSIVPYGFSNLQSSRFRAALERADGINSAAEGERDLGFFLYWSPPETQRRFKLLATPEYKGSNDFGVVALGVYSGQGLNRTDRNDEVHVVGRVAYPFEVRPGQFFETSLSAYTGRFVPRTQQVIDGEQVIDPSLRSTAGLTDQRMALSAVWYPEPIGFEAEWNIGRGPALNDDQTLVRAEQLFGGYFQVNYKQPTAMGLVYPFVRWQRYVGGRKFETNAPSADLSEWNIGAEWAYSKDIEFTAEYSWTESRTNTDIAPYDDIVDAQRLGMQVQFNY